MGCIPLRRGDRPGQAGCCGRVLQAGLGRVPATAVFGGQSPPVHEAQQVPVVSSAAYLAEHLAEVPALVIPCISPRVDGMPTWVQACIWGSVLPQAWSFMLAARARGLASAWTQIHIQFEEQVAEVLGINHAEVQQAAMIPVAYPRREDFKPAYREPIQKFTHWDSW